MQKQKKKISDDQVKELKCLIDTLPENEKKQFSNINELTSFNDLKKLAKVAEEDLCGEYTEGGQRNNFTTTKHSVTQEIIDYLKEYKKSVEENPMRSRPSL